MRLFFALNFSAELRDEIARVTRPLVEAAPRLAWVRAELLHLTLKFLGERDPAQLPDLALLGRDAVRRHRPHEVAVTSVGAFPNLERPRVVWVGMKGGEVLAEVAAALDVGTEVLGVPRDTHPFRPHVTLARVKQALTRGEAAALAQAATALHLHLVSPVRSIELMSSRTTAQGPHYEVVQSFPLGGH